jgi:hypothetical protein
MISQICIAIIELIAVYLMQHDKYSKYASFFGISAQPFWFYSSYTNNQFGMVFICFLFTLLWIKNFKDHWIDKNRLTKNDYYCLILDALDDINNQKLDKKDYIKRVLKEALNIK